MVLPLQPTEVPGIYRRGSKFVVVYRVDGRQRKQTADTLADAKAIKLQRAGETRALRRGPTLHAFGLSWLDRYAGTGHDTVRANTRREYRRLLVNFALTYFDREVRVRDLDAAAVQQFVDWLTTRPGRDGRLCDRSIANTLTPLRLALDAAVAEGLLVANPAEQVVLPRRRKGRAWSASERRYLTRAELVRLLDEVPEKWRPLFELLAATGLRISEAVGLRWSDLVLDGATPHLHVKRAIVKGAIVAPKSRHGARLIPLTPEPRCCMSIGRLVLLTTRSCFPGATAPRQTRAVCVDVNSSRPPPAPVSRASGFTPCATPARRCSSSPA